MRVDDSRVEANAADRLRLIDPLLPERLETPHGCAARFTATGPDGQLTATAGCEHWAGEPGSLDLVWGAARRFSLVPRIAGNDVADALGQLIVQWREHLAGLPETAGPDTAAVVNWPNRDIDGIRTLIRHGLFPLDVLAVRHVRRPAGHPGETPGSGAGQARPAAAGATGDPGIAIRQAGPDDLGLVARFAHEEIKFDAHFGCVIDRPEAAPAMRQYIEVRLAEPEPWTWLAERDGAPIGMLTAERPAAATWVSPLTSLSPVAYLMSAFVLPAERGSGAARLLTDCFHETAAKADIYSSLLHYELFNPLSVPFWSRQGYRPLWTAFEARPARELR